MPTPWGTPWPWETGGDQQATPDASQPIGGAASATAPAGPPPARYLSPQEQQAIIDSIGGRSGWFVVGGAAVPETKATTNALGNPVLQPTGAFTITISDGQGNTEPVTIYPGSGDANGNPTWIPQKAPSTLPKPPAAEHPNVTSNGTTYIWGTQPDGTPGYVPAPGIPQNAAKAANLEKVIDPNTGKPFELLDPVTGVHIPLPAADAKNAQIVQTAGGGLYSWDGTNLNELRPPGSVPLTPLQEAQARADLARTQRLTEQAAAQNLLVPGQMAEQAARTAQTQQATQQAQQLAPLTAADLQARIAQTQQTTQQAQALAPLTQADLQARIAQTQQATAQSAQLAPLTAAETAARTQSYLRPTQLTAGPDQPYITTMLPTGQVSQQINPAYVPKTMADVASRVGQLQQLAQSQRDVISQKLQSGAYGSGPDAAQKAAAEFDSWWSQNVEPQKAGLQAAQSLAYNQEQRAQQEQARLNLGTAQQAGQQAIQAAQATLPYTVGPGFGAAINKIAGAYGSGKAPQGLDIGSAITFQLPDLQALATQATNQALAHISPMAANAMNTASGANTPNYGPSIAQPVDLNAALNASSYQFAPTQVFQPAPVPYATQPVPPPPPPQPYPQTIGTPPLNFGNTLAQGTGTALPPYAYAGG